MALHFENKTEAEQENAWVAPAFYSIFFRILPVRQVVAYLIFIRKLPGNLERRHATRRYFQGKIALSFGKQNIRHEDSPEQRK
jgi:hypothetical protein